MADRGIRTRFAALSVILSVLAAAPVFVAPAASAQEPYVPITGSGSTWAYSALDQWRRNIQSLDAITVNYAANGSSAGRVDYRNGVTDFGVSENEYGLTDNGVTDPLPGNRGFAYMPIVAGGTAFMYNLKIGDTRVSNLRLSGENIAKIFSRQITDWSDPAIKVDNPGLTLPARPIVPVVRSDGSGTTAQFTRWMAATHGAIWDAYCGRPNCGFTSVFPVKPGVEATQGSNGVVGAVASPNSEGAITYVEYSYARNAGFPVAKVLNDAGYFTGPTAGNVAVALSRAAIRPDLTADLTPVYAATDPRSYPLSSYSYLIVPTDLRANFTMQKGRTLSEFLYYAVCAGQQQADALGYSPLPGNLVSAGLEQVARIPGATGRVTAADLRNCANPNIGLDGSDALATRAPPPEACDHAGPTQCGSPAATPTPTPAASPTPIAASPTPTPTASPTPVVTPTPIVIPTPVATPVPPTMTPRPHTRPGTAFAERFRRIIAELLARIFGSARGQVPPQQVLALAAAERDDRRVTVTAPQQVDVVGGSR